MKDVLNIVKEKYVYSGNEITFDSACLWRFDIEFGGNVIIVGVDNSSWSHSDNPKSNFLILAEGPTYGINGSFGWSE